MGGHAWSTIAIELAIVVLGVFIGMQVSNWNQDRMTARQAADFTARLRADLSEEDWRYRFLLAYSEEVLANAKLAVGDLDGQQRLTDEALLVSAYRATQYSEAMSRRTTYDELISTGAIGLIRDQTLRETAMRVYTNVRVFENLVQEGARSRYREAFRMNFTNEVQHALARDCGDKYIRAGDFEGISGTLDYPCHLDLPADVISSAAATLRSSPEMRSYLRLRIADLETRIGDLRVNNKAVMESLRAISMQP
ncbi:MAG: hypothetical protein U1F09_15710 [Steroidobacteraceae bacterium]